MENTAMINDKSRNKGIKKFDLIFIISIILAFVFLFWKAHYGYVFNDEPFMISVGHRLLKGDRLLIHEWNTAQNIGIVYLPFIWIFTSITKSTDGLVLFLREVYVVWWVFVSCVLYKRLRRYGWISIVAVLSFALFTPLDEMSLTYNVVALSCLVLFSSYFLCKGCKICDYANGLALTVGVLAYPYLAVYYLIYAVLVILANTTKLKNKEFFKQRFFDLRLFLRVTAVAVIGFALYLWYLISGDLSKLLDGIQSMFSYMAGGAKTPLHYILSIVKSPLCYQVIAGTLIIIVSLIDKKRAQHKLAYFVLQAFLWAAQMVLLIMPSFSGQFNLIMFPINILAVQALILFEKNDKNLIVSMCMAGWIFSYITYYSSDTQTLAISCGAVVASIASFIIVYSFIKELINAEAISFKFIKRQLLNRLLTAGLILIVICQLGLEFFIHYERNYWDGKTQSLNTEIAVGSAKGIITKQDKAEKYESVNKDITLIKSRMADDARVLSLSLNPVFYLDADLQYATFSSWSYCNGENNVPVNNERYKKYFKINPEKKPDCIYILNEDIDDIKEYTFVDFGEYTREELSCGVAYFANK